jgi:hypothetical protein
MQGVADMEGVMEVVIQAAVLEDIAAFLVGMSEVSLVAED